MFRGAVHYHCFEEHERTSLDRIEAYADTGNIISSKRERTFLRNFFVISEFLSQRYTNISVKCPLSMFLRKLRRKSLDRIEAYADKGNIISSKRERIFTRNFFVICELLSKSYSFVLRKQCANPLFVESAN